MTLNKRLGLSELERFGWLVVEGGVEELQVLNKIH